MEPDVESVVVIQINEPDVDAGAATQQASKHPVEEAPYKANKKRPKKKVTAVKCDDEQYPIHNGQWYTIVLQ